MGNPGRWLDGCPEVIRLAEARGLGLMEPDANEKIIIAAEHPYTRQLISVDSGHHR